MRALGRFLFAFRGLLPVPGLVLLLWLARPTPAWFLAGLAIAFLGQAIRIAALRAIGPKSRVSGKIRTEELITHGIYACVRNPLYTGNAVMGLGLCLGSASWPLVAAYLPVVAVYYYAIIRAEERALSGTFAEAFAAYAARTPRLVPLPHRYVPVPADRAHAYGEFLPREANTITALVWTAALVGRGLVGCPW